MWLCSMSVFGSDNIIYGEFRCTASKMVFRIFIICKMQKKNIQKFDFLIWPNQCIWMVTKLRRKSKRERKTKVDNAMSIKSALNYLHCVSVWMRVCVHAVCSMQYASPIKWLQQWRCWWQFRCRMIWNELMPCVKLCGVKCIVNRRKSLKSIIEKMTRHESHPFCTPAKWHIHSATQRNQKKVAVIVVVGSSTIQYHIWSKWNSHRIQKKNRNKWKLWN